jgi:hypothetical protein
MLRREGFGSPKLALAMSKKTKNINDVLKEIEQRKKEREAMAPEAKHFSVNIVKPSGLKFKSKGRSTNKFLTDSGWKKNKSEY